MSEIIRIKKLLEEKSTSLDSILSALIHILENDYKDDTKGEALDLILSIELKSDPAVFKILEQLILTGENPSLRLKAVKIICSKYGKMGEKIIDWGIKNDSSPDVMEGLLLGVKEQNLDDIAFKEFIVNALGFFLDIAKEQVFSTKESESLVEILDEIIDYSSIAKKSRRYYFFLRINEHFWRYFYFTLNEIDYHIGRYYEWDQLVNLPDFNPDFNSLEVNHLIEIFLNLASSV